MNLSPLTLLYSYSLTYQRQISSNQFNSTSPTPHVYLTIQFSFHIRVIFLALFIHYYAEQYSLKQQIHMPKALCVLIYCACTTIQLFFTSFNCHCGSCGGSGTLKLWLVSRGVLPSPLMWAPDNTGGCRVLLLRGRICDSPSGWRRHTAAPLHHPEAQKQGFDFISKAKALQQLDIWLDTQCCMKSSTLKLLQTY